ncbi:MAG: efflux RND transporter periplasmic adaptor subunit [Vicinamibacterales bacterium]
MNKQVVIAVIIVAALAGGAFYSGLIPRQTPQAADAQQPPAGAGAPAGGRRGGGRFGATGPMTVETAAAHRMPLAQQLIVVGNLVGDATVAVVPKTAGRLQDVYVRLGDHVNRGQRVGKIEDQEIQEQVKQAEAAFQVASATIRQRDADLSLALTNVERSRSLFQRQLLPKQTLDDNEARYQAALAQLDLSRAQNQQSQARLDELRITLANTVITSPVDGFVARRAVDPGAFVGNNAPVVDVVDIRRVRLVVNVIEKDLKQVKTGDVAVVNVDAFPGETFTGRIARIAPVLDPTTRTAAIEVEIPNGDFRLKPGMYARVQITTGSRRDALVVPANAVVDINGRRGVYLAGENTTATFRAVRVGIEEDTRVEILEGINEGDVVITTGAASMTDGARFVLAGARGRGEGRRGGRSGEEGALPRNDAAQPQGAVPGQGGAVPSTAASAVEPSIGAAIQGAMEGRRGGGLGSRGDGTRRIGGGGGRRGDAAVQ